MFVSPAGQQLGIRDPRSPISTDALPWAAHFFSSAFADFENVPAIATADGGSVLVYLDRNFDSVGLDTCIGAGSKSSDYDRQLCSSVSLSLSLSLSLPLSLPGTGKDK